MAPPPTGTSAAGTLGPAGAAELALALALALALSLALALGEAEDALGAAADGEPTGAVAVSEAHAASVAAEPPARATSPAERSSVRRLACPAENAEAPGVLAGTVGSEMSGMVPPGGGRRNT
jgi:hypothetical protein